MNNFNNLIDNKNNKNENSININSSNLFNINKINDEKDIKKEKIKNNQIISPNVNSLLKQNGEPLNKNGKTIINEKPLNNIILPNNNNEKIPTINNLINHNNNLLINPSNNLLISPNNYFLNGYYHETMNRLIFPGFNQFSLLYPFPNNLLYFPVNNMEGNTLLNGVNLNKEKPTNFKENKNEMIGKKKALD